MKLLSILALVAYVTAQTPRNPNPCDGVAEGAWANDWATCRSLFYCGANNIIQATLCRPEFGFDAAAQQCVQGLTDCDACPATGFIAVASDETTCSDYTFCNVGSRWANVESCIAPLVFNRVTGLCDLPANTFCPVGGDPPVTGGDCPRDESLTRIESSDCSMFYDCVEGERSAEARSCPEGFHFDPETLQCVVPENRNPPCPASASIKLAHDDYIPAPPHVIRPVEKSFRERLMHKLHLQ